MHKKLIGAFMALAAFGVFAVMPAMSSAAVATFPTGTALATGSLIKATNTNAPLLQDTSGNTLVTCSSATLTGELTKNSEGEVQGKITSATYRGTGAQASGEPAPECTSIIGNVSVTPLVSSKAPWCLKTTSKVEDTWNVTGGACPGGGAIKFILNSTTIGECEYESTAGGVSGTYTTHPADAVLTVTSSGFKLIRGNTFFCPASGHLSQAFTLEKDSEVSEPLYIS
jgi:hypothetical protein